jgi:hypothetical protein
VSDPDLASQSDGDESWRAQGRRWQRRSEGAGGRRAKLTSLCIGNVGPDVADTWTCTTWIDLEGEDQEQVEYSWVCITNLNTVSSHVLTLVGPLRRIPCSMVSLPTDRLHWEDRNPYTRASKGRLVVDGEPVGTRYVDPSMNQIAQMIDCE